MQKSITSHTNYMICMPRGQGKSSYVECTTLFALATGQQKYVVIVSNNARAAGSLMSDIWRAIQEPETPFATDYPEVCVPFQLCKGSFRRRQLYKGRTTDIQKNSCNIVLARLVDANGKELPTSSSIITTRGISSGLRGMKHGTQRPSLVLLDDLQDSETAENAEQVEKMLAIIKKDIMNLGGKERLSILQTGTPIQPEDLIDRIKNDPNWKTTMYKGIIKFPTNMELWKRYFEIYDTESVNDEDHIESLEFYKHNREKMDEGSEVFNPSRYSAKDGHISAIQKLLEIQHVIGKSAFAAEYQMQPVKASYALDLSPSTVVSRINKFKELQVPDGFVFTSGAIDLNTSYGATITLVSFKTDTTSIVIWHDIVPMRIDQKLPDTQYNAKVFDKLMQICQKIAKLGVKIDGLAIDCGGRQWDAVNEFAKQAMKTVGIPACAFAGRSST